MTIANNALRRTQKPDPPEPIITHLEGDAYEVLSRRTFNLYHATVAPDGTVMCDCPARGACYHIGFVRVAHQRRLAPADPVKVLRGKLNRIASMAQIEDADFATLDEIARTAHEALALLAELTPEQNRRAA